MDEDWADGVEVDRLFTVLGAPDCREVCAASGQGGPYYWVPDEVLDTFRSFVPDEQTPSFIF